MAHPSFQERLLYAGQRFNEVNTEKVSLTRNGTTVSDKNASPILLRPEEFVPGIGVTRIEHQGFAIDVDQYDFGSGTTHPNHGDVITRADGEEFRVINLNNNPVFQYVTSNRQRYLVVTERIKEV